MTTFGPPKPYSHCSKIEAYTETGSPRQIQKLRTDWDSPLTTLTDEERKQLRRSQFAFGSIYPYTFDGLSYVATHYKKLLQQHSKYYYMLELPIEDWCHVCLGKYQTHTKEHFRHELLRRGSTPDKTEDNHLRCIPLSQEKGSYISIQPLIIGFTQKTQEEMTIAEIQGMKNLKTFSENTKKIRNVVILTLKPLIDPLFEGYAGGWFSCPSALQAKIIHTLKTNKQDPFSFLDPLFLRRYFLYLNANDGSQNSSYIDVDALDLCEHVAPAEIIAEGKYRNIRNWNRMREKLTLANEFFMTMETKGLMAGAKAYPTTCPKGVYYDKPTRKYRIYFKRSPEVPF